MLLNNNTDSDADKYNANAQKIYVIFAKASQTVKSIIDNGTDIN